MRILTKRVFTFAVLWMLGLCAANAQQPALDAWLADGVARAKKVATVWNIGEPAIEVVNSDYVVVLPSGAISAGRGFLAEVLKQKDGDELLQFLLLHEFRHVHQQRQKEQAENKPLLECDADFHATLRLSAFMLNNMSDAAVSATVVRVMALQRAGARLSKLSATGDQHGHLSPAQRFSIGTFAAWRAVHGWLVQSGKSTDKRYAEIYARAKSFVEPSTADETAWGQQFCNVLVNGGKSDRAALTFWPGKFDTLDGESPTFMYMRNSYGVENKSQWPLRVVGWQLLGMRQKADEQDFEGYMGLHANSIDVVIPAGERRTVTWAQIFPAAVPAQAEVFSWSDVIYPELILMAARVGARVEPPNCQASWKPPADGSMSELFSFLLRVGSTASRNFQGLVGGPKYPGLSGEQSTIFHNFSLLPARANAEKSFVVLGRNRDPSAHVVLLQTASLAEAKALYTTVAASFAASCAATGVADEGIDRDGDSLVRVKRLTPLSSAIFYLKAFVEEAGGVKRTRYDVEWVVNPVE